MRGLFLIVAIASALSGCGYHTAGHAVRIAPAIHSIAIPIFTNQTQSFKAEQTMTAAVVREFLSRTHYRIENHESSGADATLAGTVLSAQLSPLTYDSETGRASSALVIVSIKVKLTDRQGKVLFENPNYVFREQYQVSREVSSFFEEESPALERMARDFARTLVADVLENY